MPTVTLTPTAVSVTGSGGWATLEYYKNTSPNNPLTMNLTYPVNAVLSGPGVNITGITVHGYIRNKSAAIKRVQLGFRPAADSGSTRWEQLDEADVVGGAFKAIDAAGGTVWIYNRFSRTYNGTHIMTRYLQSAMRAGTAVYLGIIVPDLYRQISLSTTLAEWTIDVTYELLGNVPTTDKTSAVIGRDSVTVTVVKTIPESTTKLIYRIPESSESSNSVILRQVELGTGTSDQFSIPGSVGDYIMYDVSVEMRITAITSVNGAEAGEVDAVVALIIPEDAAPDVSVSVAPCWPPAAPEDTCFNAYIQYHSGAEFTVSAVPKLGATIEEYTLEMENTLYLGTVGEAGELENLSHEPMWNSGEVPWTITITDTRGFATVKTGTVSVIPWSPPAINRFDVYRVTEANAEAIDGTYIRASADLSCSSLVIGEEQKNSLRFHILYRKIADTPGEWITADEVSVTALQTVMTLLLKKDGLPVGGGGVDADGNDLPFNEMLGYEFQLVANDLYGESTAQTAIPSAQQFQDIDENTGNMGFGGNAPEATEDSAYRFHKQTDFPAGIQVEQQRYGWHAGDAIEFAGDMAIAGYLTGGTKDCHALLFLGQPIFAAGAGLSGSAVLRGIRGYLDNMSYATGVAAGTAGYTFTAQIMNAKAGIVRLSISKTSAFENATNNTPIVINGAGNESLVLTFV
nr:MAG TPA: protein of unknown function DUF859 [Caudoviricetes sp.]